MRVGYRRVSSIDQKLDRQELGEIDRVFEEKVNRKNKDRATLQEMISFVRAGDEVVVFSIDRLARDLCDLQSIIYQLNEKGVTVSFLSERLSFGSDSDDAFDKPQLHVMGALADFERNIIHKRQAERWELTKLILGKIKKMIALSNNFSKSKSKNLAYSEKIGNIKLVNQKSDAQKKSDDTEIDGVIPIRPQPPLPSQQKSDKNAENPVNVYGL